MENKIAVIIPAYKDTYLLNTLISINNQTDKKFNLYICNDSSPYNIEKVLADFKKINKIHFEYIKFENNLGGSDLIQYNPQIEMFARFKMKSSFHKTKRII